MYSKKIDAHTWVLRPVKGEDLVQEMEKFCTKENITLGYFTGLGALEDVELGVFHHDRKEYESKSFKGSMEIIALHGNITTMKGALYLHIHMGVGMDDLSMVGGHLNRAIINPTCEIFLHSYEGTIDRFKDEETGLNLLAME